MAVWQCDFWTCCYIIVSLLSLQECHQHVCNSRGSFNSAGPRQLRRSAGGFCHQSVWPFSAGTPHTDHMNLQDEKKSLNLK